MEKLRRIEDTELNLDTWSELHLSGPKLTSLVIHGCHLKTFDSPKLPTFETLVDLNLSSNFIVDICGSGFKSLSSLVKLDLSSNRLKGDCFIKAASTNIKFISLKQLLIPYNSITSLDGLPDVCPALESLDARNNRLSGGDTLNIIRKLPLIHTVELHLKEVDHRSAFGVVGTLCQYDGHSIDDSDSEELPSALKAILFHKSTLKPSPISTLSKAGLKDVTSDALSSKSSQPTVVDERSGTNTPRFDQLAQQRRKIEEDKAKEKEIRADQRIRELEDRLDALSAAGVGMGVGVSRASSGGTDTNQRKTFLKQPLFIPGPESPDRGPLTRDEDVGYGFSPDLSPSDGGARGDQSQSRYDYEDDDFPPTYPSSSAHLPRGVKDTHSDQHHDQLDVCTSSEMSDGSGQKISSDRLQRLRHSSNKHLSDRQGRETVRHYDNGSLGEHQVVNGTVRLVSRYKHSKSVAWDKKSPRQSRQQHGDKTPDSPRGSTPRYDMHGRDGSVVDKPQKNINTKDENTNEKKIDEVCSSQSAIDTMSVTLERLRLAHLGTIASCFGRKVVFIKLTAFHRWFHYTQCLDSKHNMSKVKKQFESELSSTKIHYEDSMNTLKLEKQALTQNFKSKEAELGFELEEMHEKLREESVKLSKCEKALEHATSQVLKAEDGVARLVAAESRVAVLQARADIEASYAEQITSLRSEHASKELEMRKQIHSLQDSLNTAQESVSNLQNKVKASNDHVQQSEEKLARLVKDYSEREKQHTHEMELAAMRTEEALKTLQSRANAKVSELQRAFTEVAHGAAESKQRAAAAVSREKQLTETVSELSSLARDQRDTLKSLRKKLAHFESSAAKRHQEDRFSESPNSVNAGSSNQIPPNVSREQELEKEYKEVIHSLELRVEEAENSIMSSVEGMKQAQEESHEWEDKYTALLNEQKETSAAYEVQHVLLADSQSLCEELKRKNEKLELALNSMESSNNEALQLLEDEKSELESEVLSLKNEIDQLSRRIEDQDEIENHLRDIVNELRDQHSSSSSGGGGGGAQNQNRHSNYHDEKKNNKKNQDLSHDLDHNFVEDNSSGKGISRGISEEDDGESMMIALKELVNEKDKLVREKDEALQFIEGELLGMKEVFEAREKQLLAAVNNEKNKIETLTNENEVKYQALSKKYQTLENEKFKLDEDYHTARKRINELTRSLDELEADYSHSKRRANHAEQEAVRFQQALHAVNNALYSTAQGQSQPMMHHAPYTEPGHTNRQNQSSQHGFNGQSPTSQPLSGAGSYPLSSPVYHQPPRSSPTRRPTSNHADTQPRSPPRLQRHSP